MTEHYYNSDNYYNYTLIQEDPQQAFELGLAAPICITSALVSPAIIQFYDFNKDKNIIDILIEHSLMSMLIISPFTLQYIAPLIDKSESLYDVATYIADSSRFTYDTLLCQYFNDNTFDVI